MKFPDLLERFLSYVKIDTQSDEESDSFPSTLKQFDLAQKLEREMKKMGIEDVVVNRWGYVTASLRSNREESMPTIALIAHMDTSPDVSGANVNPVIHKNYDGGDIILCREPGTVLKVSDNPLLNEKKGMTIITTDGKTLLGADDKAGIAEIMSALNYLMEHPDHLRPDIRILFTPDEETGRGTEKITIDEIRADAGYTVDGGPIGEIEDETFCADSVEISIKGVNVHPGYAKDKLVNAVKIASEIVERLPKDMDSPETTEGREGYMHPHLLSGNVEEAELKILIRDFTEKGLKEKEDFINNIAHELKGKYQKAVIDVYIKKSYRNMKQVLDHHPEVIEKAEEAVRQSGLEPSRTSIRGGTDGARLCFMGLPTPNLFTGGNNFHSRYEWIALEDMEKAAEVIVRLMGLWAEIKKQGSSPN
jgi:tripeptide aminopeptidase